MSQTIKRNAKGVRRAAAAQGTKRKVSRAKARSGSLIDSAMRWLPFTEQQLHQMFLFAIFAAALALAWTVASAAGLPELARARLAIAASDAGFEVKRVEVRGVKRLNELKVYELVLSERERAMTEVDLENLRQQLLGLSWIEDARVSRQLPETLVVDIVERVPYAALRKPDRLVLIDEEGRELEPISRARAKGMLTIAGPGAGKQVAGLNRLLDAAPALRPRVREAELKGNRRWDLTFDTGQVLALPEGDKASALALVSFARMDGVNRMLGGRVAIFDMRARDRIYLRVPGLAEQRAADEAAAKAAAARQKAQSASEEDQH